jgi:hypothetical protein
MPAKTPKGPSAAALLVLDKIRAQESASRFLQRWEPASRRLLYGFGDGARGVLIGSDKSVTVAETGIISSRLDRETVRRWQDETPDIYKSKEEIRSERLLFDQIRALLTAFVHFDDPQMPTLITLWIMGTHLYSVFNYYGYLFFHSLKKRSGKTRVLEVIGHLAFEATVPLNAPTTATIRDIASEGRTLQLDTLERWKGKSPEAYSAAMELLDAGFRHQGTVAKMAPIAGEWRRIYYPVYAPYSMAAIDRNSLSDTALDRAFVLEMHRKSSHIKTSTYSYHQFEKRCKPIRSQLYLWALGHAARVATVYESKNLQTALDAIGLHDRAADIWKPLFAVAGALGLDVTGLEHLAREMSRDPEAAEDDRHMVILNDLLAHVKGSKAIGQTTQVRSWISVPVTDRELHTLLSGWGFGQHNHWIDGESRRAWSLSDAKLRGLVNELTNGRQPITLQKSDQSDHAGKTGGMSLRSEDAYDHPPAWELSETKEGELVYDRSGTEPERVQ